MTVGSAALESFRGKGLVKTDFAAQTRSFGEKLGAVLDQAGYPSKAEPTRSNYPMLIVLLTLLVLYVTMVYGPIAAWLVEMFHTNIRYNSMRSSVSHRQRLVWWLPALDIVRHFCTDRQHLLRAVVSGDHRSMTFVIGALFVKETKDVDITI